MRHAQGGRQLKNEHAPPTSALWDRVLQGVLPLLRRHVHEITANLEDRSLQTLAEIAKELAHLGSRHVVANRLRRERLGVVNSTSANAPQQLADDEQHGGRRCGSSDCIDRRGHCPNHGDGLEHAGAEVPDCPTRESRHQREGEFRRGVHGHGDVINLAHGDDTKDLHGKQEQPRPGKRHRTAHCRSHGKSGHRLHGLVVQLAKPCPLRCNEGCNDQVRQSLHGGVDKLPHAVGRFERHPPAAAPLAIVLPASGIHIDVERLALRALVQHGPVLRVGRDAHNLRSPMTLFLDGL
mmetsp:Transcript_94684/g.272613  ORF Transcript_94684/g.272613 Transcript_94684/m.272613 type:complete len:294 (-) Transcript_94684:1018-1899(-)